ncbi:MAG: alpha-E domain-containing protein [Hyphomonadaceae bacterium]|nr:alpha-E domain-containing protein [Hyphomonadaceae bacterium]
MMLSRVADSFYWIGRYTERAEHACRLLQITMTAALEAGAQEADLTSQRAIRALGGAHTRPVLMWSKKRGTCALGVAMIVQLCSRRFLQHAKMPAKCATKSRPKCGSA